MPQDLPYLASYKNVAKLFEKIAAAKKPDTFTHGFLSDTLGLKSTTDRPLIPLLKTLGFLDGGGRPTESFAMLKNSAARGRAIAEAVRKAYAPLFSANERVHELSAGELKGLISQVSGSDDSMTSKIAGTFNALVKFGDFTAAVPQITEKIEEKPSLKRELLDAPTEKGLLPGFHYNIQVHLPSNGTEETYLNIFTALRKAFGE